MHNFALKMTLKTTFLICYRFHKSFTSLGQLRSILGHGIDINQQPTNGHPNQTTFLIVLSRGSAQCGKCSHLRPSIKIVKNALKWSKINKNWL